MTSPFDDQPSLIAHKREPWVLSPDRILANAVCEIAWSQQGEPGLAKVSAKFRLALSTLADAEIATGLVAGADAYWDRRQEAPEAPADLYQIPRCEDADLLSWVVSMAGEPVLEFDAPIRSLILSGAGDIVTLMICVSFVVPISLLVQVDAVHRQSVGLFGSARQLSLEI